MLRQVDSKRHGPLFILIHSSGLLKDLTAWTKTLTAMQYILTFAVKITDYSKKKELYVGESV